MKRGFLTIAAMVWLIAACGPIDTMRQGFAHARAVSADLEKSLGLKSFVSFNWSNGSLTSVDVRFRGIPEQASLAQIAARTKQAVTSEFKQKPEKIVVSFALEP